MLLKYHLAYWLVFYCFNACSSVSGCWATRHLPFVGHFNGERWTVTSTMNSNGWERTRTGERNYNSNARGIFRYRWVVLHKLLKVGILIILIILMGICPNYPLNINKRTSNYQLKEDDFLQTQVPNYFQLVCCTEDVIF